MSDPTGGAATQRPNVLFIICDQLRADHLGFAGNPVIRTPNIDSIAARGIVFDNAWVSNPVCMPNRSTMMTGRMPSAHGVIFNDRSLAPSASTFVGALRDHGWRTALIGKSHLQHGMSREAVVDFGRPAGESSPFEEGWDTVEHQERYEAGEVVAPDDFYGFGHIELTIGHGAMAGGHHYLWALEQGIDRELLRCALDPEAAVAGRSPEWWQVHPAPYEAGGYSTEFVTQRTIDFIERSEAGDEPWMAWCSFPDPHHPMSPPDPWFSRHDPADIGLPATFGDRSDDWPDHLKFIRDTPANTKGHNRYVFPFGPTEGQVRVATAATYGMIEMIDDGIGRILRRLDELGATDDTIVVFTSDHGDMMGDHGLMLKAVMHFQGCLRAPVVVAAPGRAAARSSSLAASIDLPHTVLDLCGVPEHQGMQGRSLVPVMDDAVATVRDSNLVEEDMPGAAVRGHMPLKTRTVVTDRYRYTRDSNGYEMLYDLVDDPGELTNLAVAGRAPAAHAEMLGVFADALIAADDVTRLEPVAG